MAKCPHCGEWIDPWMLAEDRVLTDEKCPRCQSRESVAIMGGKRMCLKCNTRFESVFSGEFSYRQPTATSL